MRHLQTEILVIGGGATGTGVLRDLAMRGFKCILVERRDLAYGTSGRYHGLLHSGARYVVKDPQAARECYEENQILRRIMPQCIEDTGGFFVQTPQDDPAYIPQFASGCRAAGIPVEPVAISRMLKQEPQLNPRMQQCFRVPDASADSFLAAELNAESARQYGAQVLCYHEVMRILVGEDKQSGRRVLHGVMCHDLVKDENVQIDASLLINAAGAWAGRIAEMAGIVIKMVPGKGSMLAFNHRIVNTVVNRCKLPSDGDILLPAHTVSIIGTTDVRVTDLDHYSIEPWEIRMLLDEGEKLIPQFKQFRILRAWAGIRPLVGGLAGENDRDISREYVLIDHAERDSVEGFITITSGKWTTYRKMAQVAVDKACEKLNVNRACRTHLEMLPSQAAGEDQHPYPGMRLEAIERDKRYGQLVCECELVTDQQVRQSILLGGAATLDDIRRDTRLGMGPCQGAYCAFRAAGMLHQLHRPAVQQTNVALRDFLEERWKGLLPGLCGQQLRQARFNELIYVDVLNASSLPGEQASALAPEAYNQANTRTAPPEPMGAQTKNHAPMTQAQPVDIVVIGGGLSGLFAAYLLSKNRFKTSLVTQGWGAVNWGSGCIDIYGYLPPDYANPVENPLHFLEDSVDLDPRNPYKLSGLNDLQNAIREFMLLCQEAGYPFHGSLERNIYIPTALGTLRPTCLAPESMIAGEITDRAPMLITGVLGYQDFYPSLVSDNLTAQGFAARDLTLELKSLSGRRFITGRALAGLFDEPEFRQEVIQSLKPRLGAAGKVGFPAVLGLKYARQVKEELEAGLGLPVFEIPGLPPSIPGLRLQNMLEAALENNGVAVYTGMQVTAAITNGKLVTGVVTSAASRQVMHAAREFILASGGILGGGINVNITGYAKEMIFDLPVDLSEINKPLFCQKYLCGPGHPIYSAGIEVDDAFHPTNQAKAIVFENLSIIGSMLGHCDPVRERSSEGISLSSAYSVAKRLTGRKPV